MRRIRPRNGPPTGRLDSALRLDDHRDFGRQAARDLDRDLVRAERLERLVEIDLVAIDLDAPAAERLGDLFRAHGAVELARVADLHAEREGRGGDPRGRDLVLLALLGALLLARRDVVLPG